MLASALVVVTFGLAGEVGVVDVAVSNARSSGNGAFALASVDAPVSLAGKWRFHQGDDASNDPVVHEHAFSRPDFDDSAWELVDVPRGLGEQGHVDMVGVYWLRFRLHLDD